MSMSDDHVEKVRAVICENPQLFVCKVSEEVGITESSCHTILTKKIRDASFCCKICAISFDRWAKSKQCHSQ
jgi:hypothetical protein